VRLSAALLIGGLLSFTVGAAIPLGWLEVWSAHLERYLQLIGQHRRAWSWANVFMLTAAALNAAGLAVLAFQTSQPPIVAGAAGYSIAAVFWILVVSFRSTVSIWAADELAASHRVPNSFVGIDRWSGMNFQLYTAMGHAAQAMVGLGLIATPLVPKWVAGFTIAFSVAGLLSQLPGTSSIPRLRGFFIPILMHVAPAMIGISLLVR
jgi:hypothetical protein